MGNVSPSQPPLKIGHRFWALSAPHERPENATTVIFDSNVLWDNSKWLAGEHSRPEQVTSLWLWLKTASRNSLIGGTGRKVSIPVIFPALIEAAWKHGEPGADPVLAAGYMAAVDEVSSWDSSTLKNRTDLSNPGERAVVDPQRMARANDIVARTGIARYDLEFAGDWASVLLLLPFLPRVLASRSPKERLALQREWSDERLERDVNCSAEVKLLASLVFLGGDTQLPGQKKRYGARELLKFSEWDDGLGRISRNIAFDLRFLLLWRESTTAGLQGLGAQPTVLVTADHGLAALFTLLVATFAHPGRESGPSRAPLGGLAARQVGGPLVRDYLDGLPDEEAMRHRSGVTHTHAPQLGGAELLAALPSWIDEAERAVRAGRAS